VQAKRQIARTVGRAPALWQLGKPCGPDMREARADAKVPASRGPVWPADIARVTGVAGVTSVACGVEHMMLSMCVRRPACHRLSLGPRPLRAGKWLVCPSAAERRAAGSAWTLADSTLAFRGTAHHPGCRVFPRGALSGPHQLASAGAWLKRAPRHAGIEVCASQACH